MFERIGNLTLELDGSTLPLAAPDTARPADGELEWSAATLAAHGFTATIVDATDHTVRLLGPRHPQVTAVSVVSTTGTIKTNPFGADVPIHGEGDSLRLLVEYDEPVTVTGVPTLEFGLYFNAEGSPSDSTFTTGLRADYAAAESQPTGLVFRYTVAAAPPLSGTVALLDDTDAATDGVQSPLAGGSIAGTRSGATASRFMPEETRLNDGDGYDVSNVNEVAPENVRPTVISPDDLAEDAGELIFSVVLDRPTDTPVNVNWALSGTATAGTDYAAPGSTTTGMLSIPARGLAGGLTVTVTDDMDVEDDETVIVTLSRPPDYYYRLGESGETSAQATILDNDLPQVTLSRPALATDTMAWPGTHIFELEAAREHAYTLHADAQHLLTDGAWTLTRTGDTTAALEVTVQVTEAGGDFVAPADETRHTLTIAADEADAHFRIVTNDTVDEAHGTVTVALEDGAGYMAQGESVSTVPVRDDDGGLVQFTVDPLDRTVAEGAEANFDAVLTTIDDGLQAGTFTAAEDVGRALRDDRATFFYGAVIRWQATWLTVAAEATHAGGDYTHVAKCPVRDGHGSGPLGFRGNHDTGALHAPDGAAAGGHTGKRRWHSGGRRRRRDHP